MARPKKHTHNERPCVTRLTQDTIDTIDRLAKTCNLSRSDFVATLIEKGLERLEHAFGEAAPALLEQVAKEAA